MTIKVVCHYMYNQTANYILLVSCFNYIVAIKEWKKWEGGGGIIVIALHVLLSKSGKFVFLMLYHVHMLYYIMLYHVHDISCSHVITCSHVISCSHDIFMFMLYHEHDITLTWSSYIMFTWYIMFTFYIMFTCYIHVISCSCYIMNMI